MHVTRHTVTPVSAADGSVIAYSETITGRILQIRYVKASAGNYADTVDFAITVEATGEGLWTEANITASATRAPRQATHGVDGVASLYAGSGTAVNDHIAVANDRVKIAITNAGDTKTGTFHILVG